MHTRTAVRTGAGLSLALTLALLGLTSPSASAQATCTFDDPTGAVAITLVGGAPAVMARDTAGAITLDGVACGTATVSTTDTITVTGSGQADDFTIDLTNGAFAPGRTTESDGGDAEIEISVNMPGGGALHILGGTSADAFTVGSAGVNLNAAEAVGDADVTVTGTVAISADGRDGDDVLSVAGGGGTGEPATGDSLVGGAGNDELIGLLGGSTLDGGDGTDTVDYSLSAVAVIVVLPAGTAQLTGGLTDQLLGIENVVGTPGADRIVGSSADNSLDAGAGDDVLVASRGTDVLGGGDGIDTVDFGDSHKAVTISLKDGTAQGLGDSTLEGIENVIGGVKSDTLTGDSAPNLLSGGRGNDAISGLAGRDLLVGGDGNDRLSGGADRDDLSGGRGRDQLDGGKARDTCRPGPDPDSWTNCEVVKKH